MSILLVLELLLLLIALPRLSCASNSTRSPLDRQAEALLQWRSSLGNGWPYNLEWRKGTSPCCNWAGITCSTTMPRGRDQGDAVLVVSQISLKGYFFDGRLDGLLFEDLPHLVYLDLSNSFLSGPIPSSIGALAGLAFLDLSKNYYLNGSIPPLAGLRRLAHLNLGSNALSDQIPSSIGALANLSFLDLSRNRIFGSIPPSFCNLTKLTSLDISYNLLSEGSMTCTVGTLRNLKKLYLSQNNLTGPIPSGLVNLTSLEFLDISNNHITGSIPSSMGNLMNLESLDLSYNQIMGPIGSIGNLTRLRYLDLSNNQIIGYIPLTFSKLIFLTTLALGSNQLNGLLSPVLGSLVLLSHLNLSSNQFVGSIPPQIRHCRSLSSLLISNNLLTGQIPQELGYLSNLYMLDLSRNNLSGAIPVTLSMLYNLYSLNLSYNSLGGRVSYTSIPASLTLISLDHNMDLCGVSHYDLMPCDTAKLDSGPQSSKRRSLMPLLAFFAPLSFCLAIASITIAFWRKKYRKSSSEIKSGDILSIWNFDGKIAFEDILSATENFDEKYCIGVGGYGSVFRVELEGGIIFAVKLLHSMEENIDEGTFHAEIEVLTKIRHRCIVKLYGFCSHSQCKFLVYDLIERGSLSSILRDQELAKELGWPKRVAVMRDVARALSYLHHDCDDPIVH